MILTMRSLSYEERLPRTGHRTLEDQWVTAGVLPVSFNTFLNFLQF